jgi:hypothetical protein
MPFTKGDPRAADAGRTGMRSRWRRASAEDRANANRVMREAQSAKYERQADDALARMGIASTSEQVGQAAATLHRADLRERLVKAREARRAQTEAASSLEALLETLASAGSGLHKGQA